MPSLDLSLSWEGHRVRMAGTPERPEWVAKDLCRVLGIHNSRDALWRAGVGDSERGSARTDTLGGPQELTTVVESGLWKLVLISRKPSATKFKAWLATDVIPSIRKHGCFPPPTEAAIIPALDVRDIRQLAPLALQLVQVVQEQHAELEIARPKVESYDRLQDARGDVSLMDAGRILGRQPVKLCEELGRAGVLFRGREGKWEPYHQYRERGLFRVRVSEVDGQTRIQTLVTPAGLQWLAARYPTQDRLPILCESIAR